MKHAFIHPNPNTFDTHRRQYFCFPRDLIFHITQNPCSSKGYEKLQKSCKYFFAKNRIVVANVAVKFEKDFLSYGMAHSHNYNKSLYFNDKMKLWLGHSLSIQYRHFYAIKRCNLQELTVFDQNITLNEMDLLLNGGKIKRLWLIGSNIRDHDGTLITCDKILAKVPNISQFYFYNTNEIFTDETFKNMNDLVFKSKLAILDLAFYILSQNADPLLLCDFVQRNASIYSIIKFHFKLEDLNNHLSNMESTFVKLFKTWPEPGIYISKLIV